MLVEHSPIVLRNLNGLYDRGSNDTCPIDHLIDTLNTDLSRDDIRTRKGSTSEYAIADIRRIHYYKKLGEATRVIVLNGSGQLFDASQSLVTPILSIAGMTDFSLHNYYNRAYITPHNGMVGTSGEFLYVYDGTIIRKAAGNAPSGFSMTIVTSALSGNVEAGYRMFAIAYESSSGFITKPGPAVYVGYTGPGGFKIDISNMPALPTGMVAIHILSTAVVTDFSGNQNDYELFFVPGGRVTGTTATVNFYETELVNSADYLIDQYEEIPAGVGLTDYGARLLVYGIQGNDSVVLVSKAGEPESISQVDGLITTNPQDSSGVKNCREARGLLYIYKSLVTYGTQDNGNTPDTWNVITIDPGIGAEPFSIADILDKRGAHRDKLIIASRNGLNLFAGSYTDIPLTWKIAARWKRINKLYFHKVQAVLDPINGIIYVVVPLDNATTPSHMFVGYYDVEAGLTPQSVKWSVWTFYRNPTCIAVDVDFNTLTVTFRFGSISGNIFKLSDSALNDNNNAIESYIRFPFVPSKSSGALVQLGGIRSRITGNGTLLINVYSLDDALSQSLPSWSLANAPGKMYTRQANFVNEQCSVKFSMTSINEYFTFTNLSLFMTPVWATRPE